MIIDYLENVEFYSPVVKYLNEGLAAMKQLGPDPAIGKYATAHGWLMVQQGNTKPCSIALYECHRQHLDVQIVIDGAEEMAWDKLIAMECAAPYDTSKDVIKFKGDFSHHMMITKGMFYIVFPQDAHCPAIHVEKEHQYKKIVMKLPII